MKMKIKALVFALLTLATIGILTGCAANQNPYEKNNEEGYTVSVKFDANGGVFTTNTSVVVDSFNISQMNKNSEGNVEIPLLSIDDPIRGKANAFTPTKAGYFLAGWYSSRTELEKDSEGNPVYIYSDKWDFEEDCLEVDASKEYSSAEPVMTLYAAWVPMFEIQFYSLADGECIGNYTYNPMEEPELKVPAWNEKTGVLDMYKLPEKEGYTYDGIYYDAEGKELVDTQTITHSGVIDYNNGVAKNSVMKLYVDLREGEWYRIYNETQFVNNASVNGCYELFADLDFSNEIWPTSFVYGNFAGSILGNGHTIKNVTIEQTNNSKTNAGLFGNLTEKASISDVTFENISFTIKKGPRMEDTSYGLFAGTISEAASLNNVNVVSSTLKIDSECYFVASRYYIGLLCGSGNFEAVANPQISCEATGKNPENVKITVVDNEVTVEIVTP